jgi:hypothetical protein
MGGLWSRCYRESNHGYPSDGQKFITAKNVTGCGPQPEAWPLWISALVRTAVSKEIMESNDMGNQLEGCSESTWRAIIRVYSLVCYPLVRQNTNPGGGTHNNIQTNENHSAHNPRVHFDSLSDIYASSVPRPLSINSTADHLTGKHYLYRSKQDKDKCHSRYSYITGLRKCALFHVQTRYVSLQFTLSLSLPIYSYTYTKLTKSMELSTTREDTRC